MATDTYTTAGTHTWTCPAGVTSVQVECWGGGGGNSSTAGTLSRGGGGGGGGAYSKSNAIAVTPGVDYTVTVGAGRAGNQNGGAAGSSSFVGDASATCLAVGGVNGSAQTGGAGGAAASCTGDTKYSGGNGGTCFAGGSGGSGGGSSAGTAAAGNNGTASNTTMGVAGGTAPTGGGAGGRGGNNPANGSIAPGSAPGGGAGGRCNSAASAQSGADGQVILTYTASSNSTITANQGSYTLTGQAATLKVARRLTAETGVYTLSGQSNNLLVARTLSCNTGSLSLTGQDASLTVARTLAAESGSYALGGQSAKLLVSRVLEAEVGGFNLDGSAATLTYSGGSLRPGEDFPIALRIEYTTLFIPGAVDLGTFCEVPLDCSCPDITAPPSPDGTLDPDTIPFWFYQYIVDTYTYPASLFGGALAAMVAAAQCVVTAGDLDPDPSDPATWDETYCATGGYTGWQSIYRRWQAYLNLYYLPTPSVTDPGLITVNYDRVQFPPGTRILDQRCEIATVDDICCT